MLSTGDFYENRHSKCHTFLLVKKKKVNGKSVPLQVRGAQRVPGS